MKRFCTLAMGLGIATGAILLYYGIVQQAVSLVLWASVAILVSYASAYGIGFFTGWKFSHELERTVYRKEH
jgi:hypothetical protein